MTLQALQSAFMQGLLQGVVPRNFPPDRFHIYQNTVRLGLIDVLAATYPVVRRLVGEDCFFGVARHFILQNLPNSGCLDDYGGLFAEEIAALPFLSSLPYLSDVARLEWLWHLAYCASDQDALSSTEATLMAFDDTTTVNFGGWVLASPYPVVTIWQAHQEQDIPLINVQAGGECALVYRDHRRCIQVDSITPALFTFYDGLACDQTLHAAMRRAQSQDKNFDITGVLMNVIRLGLLKKKV